MLVSALAADKVGKLLYHDDYKELLKAPNVSNGGRKLNFASRSQVFLAEIKFQMKLSQIDRDPK